jgi:hypothetical protein
MGVKTLVSLADQLPVEASLAHPRLIACHEQNGPAPRIKGEGYSPFSARRRKAQLLHIGMAGSIQCIDARAPQLRAELLE